MSNESLLLQLRPQSGRLQEDRRWTDSDVKKMLTAFARDMERVRCLKRWRSDKLQRFIDNAFGECESKCVTIKTKNSEDKK